MPRRGDRPAKLAEIRFGPIRHAGIRLGVEVLNDDLLDMAVAFMKIPDRLKSGDAVVARLADPDQDAGGERYPRLAGEAKRPQAQFGILVRRSVVDAARPPQRGRGSLEHEAHRRGNRAQQFQILGRHDARVEVRQESGFLKHQRRHFREIGNRRGVPERGQFVPRRAVPQFRLVAEREQGLRAAGGLAGSSDPEDLVRAEIGRLPLTGRSRETAVVADVPA